MKKCLKILRLSLIFSMIIFLIGSMIKPVSVTATTITNVTGLTAQDAMIKDAAGQPISQTDVTDQFASYTVSWNWSVPDSQPIQSGDTVTVEIPSNISTGALSFPVYATDGVTVIGQFDVTAGSHVGTITFNNYFETHPVNKSGNLQIFGNGTSNISGNNEWDIAKVGYIDSSTGLPTWAIPVNPKSEIWNNVVITDTPSAGQTINWNSLTIEAGSFDSTGNFQYDQPHHSLTEGVDYTVVKNSDGSFSLHFARITTGLEIVYTTTPDGSFSQLSNQVQLGHDNISGSNLPNASASINIGGSGSGGGQELTSLSGLKTWKDNNNSEGTRPDSITVNLLQNGTQFQSQTVSPDATGNWTYHFVDLPKYDANGSLYVYSVSEINVPGYVTTVDGDNLINTLTGTTSLSGTKTWQDDNNSGKTRPSSITVNLLQNGTQFQSQTVSPDAAGNWQYNFTDLPKYDQNGGIITYTVTEDKVDGYISEIKGNDIVNTLIPEIPTTPEQPSQPNTPGKPNKPTESTSSSVKPNVPEKLKATAFKSTGALSNEELPETGESNGISFILVGIGVLSILGVGFILHKRSSNKKP